MLEALLGEQRLGVARAAQRDLADGKRDPLLDRVDHDGPAGLLGGPLGRLELALDQVEARSSRSRGRTGRRRRSAPSSSGGREPPARSSSR